jgi:hypothetical protein
VTAHDLGWHVIDGATLLHLLRSAGDGDDPDLLFAWWWANADHEDHSAPEGTVSAPPLLGVPLASEKRDGVPAGQPLDTDHPVVALDGDHQDQGHLHTGKRTAVSPGGVAGLDLSKIGTTVVVCPGCGQERWYGYGPCSSCGTSLTADPSTPEPTSVRPDSALSGRDLSAAPDTQPNAQVGPVRSAGSVELDHSDQ